jgi:hypothetical protein
MGDEASDGAGNSYFQPASLNRLAYSLPMSPMPMMPTEIDSISAAFDFRRRQKLQNMRCGWLGVVDDSEFVGDRRALFEN